MDWAERQAYDVTIFAAGPRESATRIITLSRLSSGAGGRGKREFLPGCNSPLVPAAEIRREREGSIPG